MTVTTIHPTKEGARRRKAHKKSRGGCSNCKLRRVKCDEAKPRCQKCLGYGVDCSYDAQCDGDLQLSVAGAFTVDVPQATVVKTPSLDNASLGVINHTLAKGYSSFPLPTYHLSVEDLNVLKRFQSRTVLTIGTASLYKTDVVRLASCSPFLMHTLLALTLMHDRYIAKSNKLSVAEAYHSHQGVMLFNHILARPIKPCERDALWVCAGLFGAITFCAVEVTSPEEAWPLRPASYQDLDWLSISDGKKEIARLAYPEGPESVSRTVGAQAYVHMLEEVPDSSSSFDAFPDGFTGYFDLTPCTPPGGNLYHRGAAILNTLLPQECNYTTVISFFAFIGHISPEYKELLQEKDPRALLLLAYWYAKLCEYHQWWIFKRALIECQAICIYLRRYHWRSTTMLKLLKFPISKCGLTGSTETANRHWMFPI